MQEFIKEYSTKNETAFLTKFTVNRKKSHSIIVAVFFKFWFNNFVSVFDSIEFPYLSIYVAKINGHLT